MKVRLLVVAALAAACGCSLEVPNPKYCDESTPCKDPRWTVCNLPARQCLDGDAGVRDAATQVDAERGDAGCSSDEHRCGLACFALDDSMHCGADCLTCTGSTPDCDGTRCVCRPDSCASTEVCFEGACQPRECNVGPDCVSPPECHMSAGATCVDYSCSFPLASDGASCGMGHCCAGGCYDNHDSSRCGVNCQLCTGRTPVCDGSSCVCVDSSCGPGEVCAGGRCVGGDCTGAGDCTSPPPCRVAEGAVCNSSHKCEYPLTPDGVTCTGGTCCDGWCVDISSDALNCSACGTQCPLRPNASWATCVESKCASQCEVGYADCDGVAENGCEASLDTDGSNCGACGHDCRGAACASGMCAAVTVASAEAWANWIALDNWNVYWTGHEPYTGDAIRKASVTGGAPSTLTPATGPLALVLDATAAFFGQYDGTLMRVSLSGGAAVPVSTAQGNLRAIALDTDFLYWTGNDGVVKRVVKGGGTPATVATGPFDASDLVIAAGYAYWAAYPGANLGQILRAPVTGGTPETLVANRPAPGGLAISGSNLFWTEDKSGGGVYVCSITACDPTTLADGQESPRRIAFDSGFLYWLNSGNTTGTLMRISADGGVPLVLARDLQSPTDLAVGGTEVYWVNWNSSVMKVAK